MRLFDLLVGSAVAPNLDECQQITHTKECNTLLMRRMDHGAVIPEAPFRLDGTSFHPINLGVVMLWVAGLEALSML